MVAANWTNQSQVFQSTTDSREKHMLWNISQESSHISQVNLIFILSDMAHHLSQLRNIIEEEKRV